MKTKTCTKCREEKPLDGFARCSSAKDGKQPRCRACQTASAREWNARNKDRVRENDRARYRRDPEKRKAVMRQIRERDPEAQRAKGRAWSKAKYRRDPAKARALTESWKRRNPERAKLAAVTATLNYVARKKAATGTHTGLERRALMASYLGLCAYCTARATCLDHVTPISRGGTNAIANLVPACRSCNSSKRDRTLLEFLVFRKAG